MVYVGVLMVQSQLPRFVLTCKRVVCKPVLLSLGPKKTLDQGVEKVRFIYKNLDNVGIKDRCMIWNA